MRDRRGDGGASRARRFGVAAAVGLLATTVVVGPAPTVLAAGTPLSTGLDADGQLGNGAAGSRQTPGTVVGLPSIKQIASGREHAYALDTNGHIWAWGDNSKGQIGDGGTADRQTPVQIGQTLGTFLQVEAGHYHGIALRNDGTVWTWGYGNIGQLGLGTTNNRRAPVQVPGLSGIKAVAGGRDMSYALAGDGTMWAWGLNSFGEVGDGTTAQRLSPVKVKNLTNVVEIAGGRNHALVRRGDGSVWVWGANDYGQLGDGTLVSKSLPKQILPAGSAAHVDTGAEHSLVAMANGTVRAWGRNQRGQLGIGSTTAVKNTPQVVPGLSGIVEVGDGRDSSFAMNAAGQVWAWGFNDTGQLGDGTVTLRRSPVALSLTGIGTAQGGRGHTIFLPR